jgi:hypothetical protein
MQEDERNGQIVCHVAMKKPEAEIAPSLRLGV